MTLDDSLPKQLYTQAPAMHLLPIKNRKVPEIGAGIYRCPVYKELSRKGTLSTTGTWRGRRRLPAYLRAYILALPCVASRRLVCRPRDAQSWDVCIHTYNEHNGTVVHC